MSGCCSTTRPDDGVLDRIAIERAAQGQQVPLTTTERHVLILRLAQTRKWGLDLIAQHVGMGRSQVADILARAQR